MCHRSHKAKAANEFRPKRILKKVNNFVYSTFGSAVN